LVGTVDGGSASHHSSSSAHSSSSGGAAGLAGTAIGDAPPAAAAAAGGVGGVLSTDADAAGVVPWLRLVVSAGPAAGRRFETCNQAQEVRVCGPDMNAGRSCIAVTYVRTAGVLPCWLPGGQFIIVRNVVSSWCCCHCCCSPLLHCM
jgi:hypothetical protein